VIIWSYTSYKKNRETLVTKRKITGHGRWRFAVFCCAGLLAAPGLTIGGTANVAVRVTFVDPITISEVNALDYGSLDRNLAQLETVTIAPDSTVSDPEERIEGGSQAAAKLTVSTTPGLPITINVGSVSSGPGYSLANFQCSYESSPPVPCESSTYSETSVASGTLTVGATLVGNGEALRGAANGSFEVIVSYQ
jgi:hypothetical protein